MAGIAAAHGRFSYGWNTDPEYHYLFNALRLVDFHLPATWQHPGVPVVAMMALVLQTGRLIQALGGGWTDGISAVIEHHEAYLSATAWLFVMLICGLSYFAGRRIYRLTGSIWPGAAAQLAPLLSAVALTEAFRVSPEPVLLIVGYALLYVLAPISLNPAATGRGSAWRSCLTGFLLGAGVATRYPFLVALPLLMVLPGWRERLRGAAAFVGTLVLLLTPLWMDFGRFSSYTRDKLRDAGVGSAGIDWALLSEQLGQALAQFPLASALMITCFLTAVAAGAGIKGRSGGRYQYPALALFACSVAMGGHIVMMTLRLRPHYYVAAVVIMCIMAPHLVYVLQFAKPHRWLRVGVAVVVLLAAGHAAFQSAYGYSDWRGSRMFWQKRQQLVEELRAERPGCYTATYYVSSHPTFGLMFGNNFARSAYADALEQRFPGQTEYHGAHFTFTDWAVRDAREEVEDKIRRGECVLLQGNRYTPGPAPGYQLRPLPLPGPVVWGPDGLFEVSLDASNPVLKNEMELPDRATVIEAEEFDRGNVSTLQLGSETVIAQEGPGYAEYDLSRPTNKRFVLQVRYSAKGGAPVKVWLGDKLLLDAACVASTGGEGPEYFRWHDLGGYRAEKGDYTLRLESEGAFPAIDRFAVIENP